MRALFLCLILGLPSSVSEAVTLLQQDHFDGGREGWGSGGANPNPPVVVTSGGASGSGSPDPYLRTRSNATNGAGGRLAVFNESQWRGDYTSAGVMALRMRLLNESAIPLTIRVAINGPGGWFVSNDAATLGGLASWGQATFSLQASDLTFSVGSNNVAATLANVTQLRLVHNPGLDHRSVQILASFGVDGITAIPEPGSLALGLLGVFLVSCLRRRT